MSKPRVGMVINSIGLGGVPEVVYQLIRHASGIEYEQKLFILKLDDQLDDRRMARVERFKDLGVSTSGAHPKAGKVGAIAALADWLRTERIDILHTHSYRPNVYGRLAGMVWRQHGLRIVAHYHNDYSDKWIKDETAFRLERNLVNSTDAFIAVSQAVGQHVSSRLSIKPDDVHTLHNGIDIQSYESANAQSFRAQFAIDSQRPVVGVVGRICEQKGQDLFVEAVCQMKPSGPMPQFLIMGEPEDKSLAKRLTTMANAHSTQADVRFLGHVEDMPSAYAALDILVAPSRWEGFALMLLEAMAAGVPIIASRIPPIEEAVGNSDCAILVAPNDAQALSEAIETVLGGPERMLQMSEAGPDCAEQFSWTNTQAQLLQIYDRVLGEERALVSVP